jgi:hypothetical protein
MELQRLEEEDYFEKCLTIAASSIVETTYRVVTDLSVQPQEVLQTWDIDAAIDKLQAFPARAIKVNARFSFDGNDGSVDAWYTEKEKPLATRNYIKQAIGRNLVTKVAEALFAFKYPHSKRNLKA